jgi:Cu(I)/Ag(I) efflux system membrane fusion protein
LQNLGIRTTTAERGRFWRRVDTVGTVQADERRIETVQSRTAGWVEKLRVRAEGDTVKRGELLAEIYSPELLAAQEEYLLLSRNPADAMLAQSARDRLSFLGLGPEQISGLERDRRADQRVRVFAPIGGVVAELGVRQGVQVGPGMSLFSLVDLASVWLIAEVPENQVAWIGTGKTVEAKIKALPGEVFEGKVEYIYPEVSPVTRTVRVRARLANPGLKLRPGMVADVTLFGGARKDVLLVPSEALIHTGRRSVVIVAEPGGRFRAAEVVTGMEDGERTEVLRGLEDGAQVVVSGQFLIDSEASLKTALTRLDDSGSTDPAGQAAGVASHVGKGTVRAIDAGSARLTIEHGPIATLDWPGMTMGFAVKDVALLGGIQSGQQVEFEFAESGDDYVISRLTRMETKP